MHKTVWICLTIILSYSGSLQAQIVLTAQKNLPQAGDYYQFKSSRSLPDSTIRNWINQKGPNQVWDLRNVSITDTQDYHWMAPSLGSRSSDFPSANLLEVDSLTGREYYYHSSNQGLDLLGIFNPGVFLINYNLDPISSTGPWAAC